MSVTKATSIDGDMMVGRHSTVGGDMTVQGNARISHNLRVEGWIDAPNIRGAGKGLFPDIETLERSYPSPQPGWWALVGKGLPAAVYTGVLTQGRLRWVATGEESGEATLDWAEFEDVKERVDSIDESVKGNADSLEAAETRISGLAGSINSSYAVFNNGRSPFTVDNYNMRLTLAARGFGVSMPKGIAYVGMADEDGPVAWTFGHEDHNKFLSVELGKLAVSSTQRNPADSVLGLRSLAEILTGEYLPVAYVYHPAATGTKSQMNRIVFVGRFADLFGYLSANRADTARVIYNNYSRGIFRVDTEAMELGIHHNGFGLSFNGSKDTGLLTYVANVDKTTETVWRFTTADHNKTVCVDLWQDFKPNARNNIADVTVLLELTAEQILSGRYLPIAYVYYPAGADGKHPYRTIRLLGQFADMYGVDVAQPATAQPAGGVLSDAEINRGAFLPEALSYMRGRSNNASGAGTAWYERFRLMHVSDVHTKTDLLREVGSVASQWCDAVVNTGDDTNRYKESYGTIANEFAAYRAVADSVGIPVLGCQGNHDAFCTKESYFANMVTPMMRACPDFVAGDAAGHRAYGHMDIAAKSYMGGGLRIILLDPRDVDDGAGSFNVDTALEWQSVYFSQKQVAWLVGLLKSAAQSGLNVITMMHYSFGDYPSWSHEFAHPDAKFLQDPFMIPDIIDSFQHCTPLAKTYAVSADGKSKYGLTDVGVALTGSEASGLRLKYVCHLYGHIHSKDRMWCTKSDGSHEYDMLMLGENSLGAEGTALNLTPHIAGTPNAVAASLLSVDVNEERIYRTAYGAYLPCNGTAARTEILDYRRK